MTENTRIYKLDNYATLEVTPKGSISMLSGDNPALSNYAQITNYTAELRVMGIKVMEAEGADLSTTPAGRVAFMFIDRFTAPVPEGTGLSWIQNSWYKNAAQMVRDSLIGMTDLIGLEVRD